MARSMFWIVAIALGLSFSANADVITVSGLANVDDAPMRMNTSTGNADNVASTSVRDFLGRHSTYTYRSILSFNIAGNSQLTGITAAQITKAEIVAQIRTESGYTGNQTFNLHRLRRDFHEADFSSASAPYKQSWKYFQATGATYPSYTTADAWTLPGADDTTADRYAAVDASFVSPATTNVWVETKIDVTQYVKDVLSGANDYGWLIKAANESTPSTFTSVQSSETTNSSETPVYLKITYQVPEPATSTLLLLGGIVAASRRLR